MIELSNYLYLLKSTTACNQPSVGPIHLEQISERCDISVLPRHCWSGWMCLDSLRGPQWDHTTLAKRDQITSNYAEKTSSAQGSKTATQRQKKPRLMELFQNRQNGRREAIRTFKVTLRTRKALVYRKQNQNWGKPDDVRSDASKSACASGNFH